jgi:hypothetical protein
MHEETAMPTLTTSDRLPDIKLPDFDRLKSELSDIDLTKLERPKVLSDVEVPKMDVGKALAGAAVAVGLSKPRRSRWPFVIVGGIAVAVVGWALLNADAIRERIGRAKGWIDDRMTTTQYEDELDDAVAFTSAPTAPLDQPSIDSVAGPMGSDYPEGLGATSDPLATNGRKVGASTR